MSCSNSRRYYWSNELPQAEAGRNDLAIGPGPWPEVPAVLTSRDSVPDDLILQTLRSLMSLPGAASCGADGRPLPDASEYCVAVYRTPEDWRVTWPLRKPSGSSNSCVPPFGGVEDADFGRGLVVFGYAHNHTCGLFASSEDLKIFPAAKAPSGPWVFVGYAISPDGEYGRDSSGMLIPAWAWLATGTADAPRFYKWDALGRVFRWDEGERQWDFQAVCEPQSSSGLARDRALPPRCSPELVDWY